MTERSKISTKHKYFMVVDPKGGILAKLPFLSRAEMREYEARRRVED